MKRLHPSIAVALLLAAAANCAREPAPKPTRLETIRQRGTLGCGVEPAVPGFAEVDATGRYRGLDVDICRAMAAAIFGTAEKITYVPAPSAADFRQNDAIDVISRRITWELRREWPYRLLFGPIVFYDGQGFLVAKALGVSDVAGLDGRDVCVAAASVFDVNLESHLATEKIRVKKVFISRDPHDIQDIADDIVAGRCTAYTADVSLLAAIRSTTHRPQDFEILDKLVSREPLAQIVRDDDPQFFDILRWSVFALINAEELGVTSANIDGMRASENVAVRRLLGVSPGNGKALGLSEDWAYQAIKAVGNYGEIFERNIGRGSPLGLNRGLNRLASDGGLMYAPPLR